MQSETARTLRSGKWVHDFPARELVPGDLIELRTGRAVQVDRFKTGVERALGFSAWNQNIMNHSQQSVFELN